MILSSLAPQLDGRVHLSHVEENVHMVGDTSNNNVVRIQVSNNCCEVGMDARPYFVMKERLTVFSAED
jgi:hypothetical protein